MRHVKSLLLLILLALPATALAQLGDLSRLLRQPDIQGNRIAFVYGGDIWISDMAGGMARRLTSGEGMELFPKFSPDGKQIAFTGEYSGTKQVYVVSVDGGQPRQLTYYNDVGSLPPRGGIDNRILDWSPDGKTILFLPHRLPWSDRMGRPYIIPAAGGDETPLEIPEGGGGMYSPDGTKIVYTPIEREFRTWKRYRGGRAQDVWIYDLAAHKAEQLTNDRATDNQPMWIGNTIYFTSDRERTLNLFAYDLKTKQTKKITNHTEYDVLWPSADKTQIVYENGGYIWRYDTASGKNERVPIKVSGDLPGRMPYFKNVKGNIDWYTVSPTGVRALFGARGDVFTAPVKNGEIRNLTQSSGVRELDPIWSPDGRLIAYLSDRSGEYEIYVRNADGSGDERKVTSGNDIWRFPMVWSPDSKLLVFADKTNTLRYADASTGKITDVDHSDVSAMNNYVWAPDSRWIAYSRNGENTLSQIWVYSLPDGKTYQLTSGMTDDDNPVFDPKGRYLYFTSSRDFSQTFSAFEFNFIYTNATRVYVAVLAKDGPALFLPTSDEEKVAAATPPDASTTPPANQKPGTAPEEKKAEAKPAAAGSEETAKTPAAAAPAAPKPVKIDVAGFEQRVRSIPGAPGNYRGLSAVNAGVLYITGTGRSSALKLYNIDDKKEDTVLEGINGYEVSANGEKLLYVKGDEYGIVAAKPGQKSGGEAVVPLDKLDMKIDPPAEWTQEFTDAWRILRDWFYDPNTHGVDWKGIRTKYGQLVPYAATRADLDSIFGEVAGELAAGHVYVGPAPDDSVKRVDTGLLGAEIVRDASGYYRIQHIFPGENWHESFRSPLTEPGVKVKEGDYILAVDGQSTKGVENFYSLLEDRATRVVTLSINGKPETAGARDERVRPIAKETDLRYLDWVKSRRDWVDKASGGRIGYIHLPNTGGEGNRELFKYFYPQANKDALIIDDRYNGGGQIPDRMIELLDRPLLNYWVRRGLKPQTTPGFANNGPKVCLINGYSSSGGDAFPYYFKKRGLGTLIGTRTWGGLIGISGNPNLMDGGSISAPQFRFLDTEGRWAIENEGVPPDIEVVDRPDLVAAGKDPSLEKAIEVLMQQLREKPPVKVTVPPPPVNP
jgi:tricorn protease